MEKTIIAGVASLLLSAGVAVAQSNSDQNSMSAGTSASAGTQSNSDTATAPAPQKARHVATHYPKGEARLNREEARQTKQLNMQESQEIASNSSGSGSMSNPGSSSSQPQ